MTTSWWRGCLVYRVGHMGEGGKRESEVERKGGERESEVEMKGGERDSEIEIKGGEREREEKRALGKQMDMRER